MNKPIKKSLRLCIFMALGFMLLFMGLQLFGFWLLTDGKVNSSIIGRIFHSPGLIKDILFFFFSLLSIHVLLAALWVLLAGALAKRLLPEAKRHSAILMGFLLVLLWLLLANSLAFPDSSSAHWAGSWFITPGLVDIMHRLISFILLLVAAGGIVSLLWDLPRRFTKRNLWGMTLVLLVLISVIWLFARPANPPKDTLRQKPDILLIGLDDLRTDHVGFFQQMEHSLTPNLDRLLNDAVRFQNAWTPLARTQPAWLSILTGQYPRNHGAEFNLMHPRHINMANTLGNQIGKEGYHRLYAIDETRFSNIDKQYGFDQTVTPGIGAADFLMSRIADTPLLNLISGSFPAKWLFPFVYMNRGISLIYRPEVYSNELARAIEKLPQDKPLFLAAHFELPHWPHVWNGHESFHPALPRELAERSPVFYQKSVARVDSQLSSLLDVLRTNGRLSNTILFVFSDHGETFFEKESHWTWQGEGNSAKRVVLNRQGHGTSVVNESQNRVVFAVAAFGAQRQHLVPHTNSSAVISLIDIRPTLNEWLNLSGDHNTPADGLSLLPLIRGKEADQDWSGRAVTIETGFSLPSIEMGNPDAREAVQAGTQFYDITPQGRLFIRAEWLSFLRKQKQYAAVSGHWMLAAFPADGEGENRHFRLLNLKDYSYWDAKETESLPAQAPLKTLKAELVTRFKLSIK